jgi:hypothetical protein
MKLNDIPMPELRRILCATERDAGPDSMEARVLRRELVRRGQQTRQKRRKHREGERS